MGKIDNKTGRKYGRLLVIREVERPIGGLPTAYWLCKCDCGNDFIISARSLQSGNTKSCGCLKKEITHDRGKNNATHGGTASSLYNVWRGMKKRCNCKNNHGYKRYGERGISICEEWTDFANFQKWSFENGYEPNLTIDRIDNDGNYEPSNCRWATWKEQARNRWNTVYCEIDGIVKPLIEWSEIYGESYDNMLSRFLNGKDPLKGRTKRKDINSNA